MVVTLATVIRDRLSTWLVHRPLVQEPQRRPRKVTLSCGRCTPCNAMKASFKICTQDARARRLVSSQLVVESVFVALPRFLAKASTSEPARILQSVLRRVRSSFRGIKVEASVCRSLFKLYHAFDAVPIRLSGRRSRTMPTDLPVPAPAPQ